MALSLSSLRIPSVSDATDAFGESKGLLICRPDRRCATRMRISNDVQICLARQRSSLIMVMTSFLFAVYENMTADTSAHGSL